MKSNSRKTACILLVILLVLGTFSLLWILLFPGRNEVYTAYIHVNGTLYKTIPLDKVDAPYEFTFQTEDGHYNTICVESGSIRISAADCPDLICVKQGAITNSLLPITCLPHKLVISLKPTHKVTDTPDAIAH